MIEDILRVYLDPHEIGHDGYPYRWHTADKTPEGFEVVEANIVRVTGGDIIIPAIKNLVRELAGHRCVRCGHPYVVGKTPGEWSPCDEECTHGGPLALIEDELAWTAIPWAHASDLSLTPADVRRWLAENDRPFAKTLVVVAQWRILTVHHLNGIKHDCRWWNLAALCQRCHLTIQGKVYMERPWLKEHSEWFKPYVAGFYAWQYLGVELSREETLVRMDELLDLEHRQLTLGGDR